MKIIVANWKMNGTLDDFKKYFQIFLSNDLKQCENKKIIFSIPYIFLQEAVTIVEKIPNIEIFSQNVYHEKIGSYTGEISAEMLSSIGVSGSIVGHSERRKMGETSDLINRKIKLLLNEKLKAIFCIGESINEHCNLENVIKDQIFSGLDGIDRFDDIIIAYEPIWAIGSNKIDVKNIEKVSNLISELCRKKYGLCPKILYGGSVNESNCMEILSLKNIDGLLVGRTSLDASKFFMISTF